MLPVKRLARLYVAGSSGLAARFGPRSNLAATGYVSDLTHAVTAASFCQRAGPSPGPTPDTGVTDWVRTGVESRFLMSWDAWTFLVLGMAVLALVRPAWAAVEQRRVRPALWRRQSFERAGGGAAMLAIAVFLVTQARHVIGRGYWDLVVVAAVQAPFMRLFPIVWVPALCWVLLVVLGLWFLVQGTRGSSGPRDSMIAIWALNEMAIFAGLLWWGVYVPNTWTQAAFINFALEGVYLGYLVGAFIRFVLAVRGPDPGTIRPDDPQARHWLGRFRRY